MSNCNNQHRGRRFNMADLNACAPAGNADCQQQQQNRNASCENSEMMANASQNHSCTQDSSGMSCPSPLRYNTSGRPFTRADMDVFAVNTSSLISETCTQDESSHNQSRSPSANQSSRSRCVLSQTTPVCMGRRFNHEEEMARNQQKALSRLRAEQTIAGATPSRSKRTTPAKCKLDLMHVGCSRGQSFDPQDEIVRQKTKNLGFIKKGRNVLGGRRIDLDRLVDYNIQSTETHGACGRRMDIERDLTFRRLNLPSPKGPRASSCPTPMSSAAQCSPTARPVCPQSSCPSPNRSANTSRSTSPNCPNTVRTPNNARCPATPTVCPPTPEAPPCNVTVTTTKRTTAPPVTPPQAQRPGSPPRSPDRQNNSTTPNNRTNLSRHLDPHYGDPQRTAFPPLGTPEPYSANATPQSNGPNLHSTYNITNSSQPQSPHGPVPSQPTGRHNNTTPYETTSHRTTPGNATYPGPNTQQTPPHRSPRPNLAPTDMPPGMSPSDVMNYWQYDIDTRPRAPPYSHPPPSNFDMDAILDATYDEDELSPDEIGLNPNISNNRCSPPGRQIDCPRESFVDLTNDTGYDRQTTQYGNITMDITSREITNGPANNTRNPNNSVNSNGRPTNYSGNSWHIPPEDMTCNNYQDRLNSTMNPSSNANTFCIDDLPDADFNFDVRNKNYLPNRTCPPEVQTGSSCPPRASLFRCLAKKLSSTYDFLSSFVTNPEPKSQPECATSSPMDCSQPSSPQNSCPYTACNDTTNYGLERLFETQFNPNATSGTPGSLKECANAKRCGRVQFDSSDKPQDPNQKAIRKAQIESLVSDSFCPGLIQSTVDGLENFNNYSFNVTLGKDAKDATKCDRPPPEEPMTLLEAFSMRIEQQRESFNKQLPNNAAVDQVVDIIDKQFADQFPTDLNRSIKSLLLSESSKEHEQVEQAKEKSFESDVQKLRTSFPDNPKIKLDVYTGHTNPSRD